MSTEAAKRMAKRRSDPARRQWDIAMTRASERAMRALADRYADEYRELYDIEIARVAHLKPPDRRRREHREAS